MSTAVAVRVSGPSGGLVGGSGAHLSIASSAGGPGDIGGRLRGRNSIEGRQAARRSVAPPEAGAKGWLLVSMCLIASVSSLAMSIWATLAPRWRPRRFLLRPEREESSGTGQGGSDRPPPTADVKGRDARRASPGLRRGAPSRPPSVGRVRSPVPQSAPLRRSQRSARNRLDRSPVRVRLPAA